MKTTKLPVIAGLCVLLVLTGCRKEGRVESEQTETIAPATPAPSDADGDTVMSQTTEIGEERSPNEGGVLTDSDQGGSSTAATGTVTTTAPPPAAPPAP